MERWHDRGVVEYGGILRGAIALSIAAMFGLTGAMRYNWREWTGSSSLVTPRLAYPCGYAAKRRM